MNLAAGVPISLVPLLAVLTAALPAHALERVTLRSGFSYDCAHTQPLDASRTRLFLASGSDDSNYIDLPSTAIATIERLPDPPPPTAAAVPSGSLSAPAASVPDLLARAGIQHNIDVELLAAVVKAESGFHAHAVSRAGAQGLMQLMPSTARELGVADAFAPGDNIAGGAAYLDSLLTRYNNDLVLALAAYNAGPAAVDRYHGLPPYRETRAYVARVLNEFKRRKLAAARSASNLATR